VHKAICESSLCCRLSESRSVQGGGQAANLTFESACRLLLTKHSSIAMYNYLTVKLLLIYCLKEGWRLNRPRHCSRCAARAQICVLQWFLWEKNHQNSLRYGFDPGTSRSAVRRANLVTTVTELESFINRKIRCEEGGGYLRICSLGEFARYKSPYYYFYYYYYYLQI